MSGGQSQNATWSPNWHNAEFEFSTLTVSGHSTVEDKVSHARPGRHPTRPRQLELQGLNEGQDPVEVHETMNFSRLLLPSMRGSSFNRNPDLLLSGVTSNPATTGRGPNSKPATANGTLGVIEG